MTLMNHLTTGTEIQHPQHWSHRRAGVLLHPTSLPGPRHCGVLGDDARRFVDLIASSGFTVWQVLPIGPVDDDLSPYLLKSVNAGNPELLDPGQSHGPTATEFHEFYAANHRWVKPYALFMSLRERYDGLPWWEWPRNLRELDPQAIAGAIEELREPIRQVLVVQAIFERQWSSLKEYAHERGILIVGDLPFYVDHDSVETWWHRGFFKLDAGGQPNFVAGVPPDYFSEDGQRWGNPLYRWYDMSEDNYSWWTARLRMSFTQADIVRIDHFRGFDAYWEIPASEPTAVIGKWIKGPGQSFFDAMEQNLGELPLIAEDLGLITPEVIALRDRFHFPGMKILQFAFGGERNSLFLPHTFSSNCVVYTGTHDNDTTLGWYLSLDDNTRQYVDEYLGCSREVSPWPMIRSVLSSRSRLAVIPMQDILGLAGEHRMNLPGTTEGNWKWRFQWDQVEDELQQRLRRRIQMYGRLVQA